MISGFKEKADLLTAAVIDFDGDVNQVAYMERLRIECKERGCNPTELAKWRVSMKHTLRASGVYPSATITTKALEGLMQQHSMIMVHR